MKAGTLRHRGDIQARDDAASQITGTSSWTTFASGVWASVVPAAGAQFKEGDKIESEITHMIKMRYLRGVKPGMRYWFEGRALRFASVRNVKEGNQELEIRAVEDAGL